MTETVEQRHRSDRVCRTGFTIVELVISVLIVGILAAVTAPKFFGTLNRMRVEAAAKRIKVDLGYLQQTAISESTTLSMSFTPASNAYSIPTRQNLDRPGLSYAVALDDSPYDAALVSAALGGDSDVQFDRYGKPDSGGTITVASGSYQETVTIDSETGKASIP